MIITITGALGHIGSAFMRAIDVPDINRINLIDNFMTQRYVSLFDLPDHLPYKFMEVDILDDRVEGVIKQSDIVVHLAAVTNAEASFHNQDDVEAVNKNGLRKIADHCVKHKTKLIFVSSTSVYGVQKNLVDETATEKELKPQSPYAETKRDGEKYLQQLGKEKGLEFITFRLGTIFGYSIGMRFHTAVNKFLWQASLGEKITVWKTALHQKRPYCALEDCIRAFNYVIRHNLFDGEIYNILTANLTVNDIIESIRVHVPDLSIELVDSPIMNQLSYNVSVAKARQRGFVFEGDLQRSVEEVLRRLKGMNMPARRGL
ncbi:MAG: SDR family oxidoreductase [Candidatus Omnitrophica bacterium]|nr:SDR family oxidoreductase [Candidatus Omnitrophota bacterium]